MKIANKRVKTTLVGVTLACAALAACDKTPTGQVVATVNGDEVTRRDLTSEVAASGTANADEAQMKAIRPMLVEGVVNRKLLVQEARRSNLDKDPQFLAMKQRADEVLLAQMLAQSWTGKIERPNAAKVKAFIAANPLMFSERKALLIDEIAIPAVKGRQVQVPANLGTSDAVAAWLKAQKTPFQRSSKPVDTLKMPKDLSGQLIAKAQSGQPVRVANGPVVNVLSVRAVRPMPIPQNQWEQVARAALQQQDNVKTTEEQLKRLRETADISYSPEFAPPATAAQPKAK